MTIVADTPRQHDPLRRPAIAVGALVALAIAVAAFGPKAAQPVSVTEARAVETRALSFFDEPDGAVRVVDAASGEAIARLDVGEGGFVRSAMRSLARDRLKRSIGPEQAFLLRKLDTGSLVLADPATGKTIRLTAFGQANAAAFAAFLDHGREP